MSAKINFDNSGFVLMQKIQFFVHFQFINFK